MKKKSEICGAQNILPTPNETTKQPHDKITRQVLTTKFADSHLIENFRFVWEKANEYLKVIANSSGVKRQTALDVVKEDINFDPVTSKASLSLEERIEQTHKSNTTKPKMEYKR